MDYITDETCLTSLRILLELGGPEDPVWVFLDSQHQHIMKKLNIVFDEESGKIESKFLCGKDL